MIAVELFTRYGFTGALRWLHVLFGITWIGLLYYFNFVQVPAFAEMQRRGPQQGDREARVAGAVVVPVGRAWAPPSSALLISGATEDYYKDFFKRANGRLDLPRA